MPPPRASDRTAAVVRLRPVASLVLGADAAYRERALAILGALGPVAFASVALRGGADSADVVALVASEAPDVVVLDATGREDGAASAIAALAAASAAVGIVVVCEQSTAAARRLGALPKWGWTQDLRRAVEHAALEGGARLPDGVAVVEAPRPAGPLAGWVPDGPAPVQRP